MTVRPGGGVDVGSMVAGANTARVAGDEQSREERAATQRAAWAYIKRRYAEDEAAELADILGLTPDAPRKPGHCTCGAVLPASTVSSSSNSQYRNGQCWWCSNGHTPKPPKSVPSGAARGWDKSAGIEKTGRCRRCDRTYRLDGDGRLRAHPAWVSRGGVTTRRPWNCKGSGLRPEDVEAP